MNSKAAGNIEWLLLLVETPTQPYLQYLSWVTATQASTGVRIKNVFIMVLWERARGTVCVVCVCVGGWCLHRALAEVSSRVKGKGGPCSEVWTQAATPENPQGGRA